MFNVIIEKATGSKKDVKRGNVNIMVAEIVFPPKAWCTGMVSGVSKDDLLHLVIKRCTFLGFGESMSIIITRAWRVLSSYQVRVKWVETEKS